MNGNGNVRGPLKPEFRCQTPDGPGTVTLAVVRGDGEVWPFAVVEHADGTLGIYDGDEVELEPTS